MEHYTMFMDEARPELTAYESVLLICCGLVKRGKIILRQDALIRKLFEVKDNPTLKAMFEDIVFRDNIDSLSSTDIEDSLVKLQTFGAIGKLNPAYEKIIIYITTEEADQFLETYKKFLPCVDLICNTF